MARKGEEKAKGKEEKAEEADGSSASPSHEGFWVTHGSRSLNWRNRFSSETFSFWNDPSCQSLLLKSNLPEGTFTRLHSLDRVTGEHNGLDPRFVIVMTSCLQGKSVADHRQECLFEDLLEDFDSVSAIPSQEEFAYLKQDKSKLPKSLQFVSPQRFVTSSLIQTLSEIDRPLPGTELEIHTSTSSQALSFRPSLKNVRVLTLPHMEFEFCNVYRGTFGKTLPLMQRHPDAVDILWNLKDYDHVFFVTLSQLVPCLKDMSVDHWSMIFFGMRVHPRSLLPRRMLAWTIRMSQFHFLRRRGLWRILRGTEETTVCKDLRAIKTRMCRCRHARR